MLVRSSYFVGVCSVSVVYFLLFLFLKITTTRYLKLAVFLLLNALGVVCEGFLICLMTRCGFIQLAKSCQVT